jgi:hypothetical protein
MFLYARMSSKRTARVGPFVRLQGDRRFGDGGATSLSNDGGFRHWDSRTWQHQSLDQYVATAGVSTERVRSENRLRWMTRLNPIGGARVCVMAMVVACGCGGGPRPAFPKSLLETRWSWSHRNRLLESETPLVDREDNLMFLPSPSV